MSLWKKGFSFSSFASTRPNSPPPGDALEQEFASGRKAVDELHKYIEDVRRSDGKLKNGIVRTESLDPSCVADIAKALRAELSDRIDAAHQAIVETRAAADRSSQNAQATASHEQQAQTAASQAKQARNDAQTLFNAAKTAASQMQAQALTFEARVSNDENHALQSANEAELWADVSHAWAEHMPDVIPPNLLAKMAISGDHFSSRWWANHASQMVSDWDTRYQPATVGIADFNRRYLGSSDHPPMVDKNGDPVKQGALYWSAPDDELRVYDGATWKALASSGGGSSGPAYVLPPATSTTLGGVKATSPVAGQFITGFSADGSPTRATPTPPAPYTLPAATNSTLGGVKATPSVAGQFITGFNADGSPTRAAPASYTLPPATSTTLGGVKATANPGGKIVSHIAADGSLVFVDPPQGGGGGTQGPQGPAGTDGHSPVLTWSGDQIAIDGVTTGPHLTGPQGLKGDPGSAGSAGSTPTLTWSGDKIAINGVANGPALTGPQGPKGDTGAASTVAGPQGPQGPAGNDGLSPTVSMSGDRITVNGTPVGPNLTGPQGAQGPTGASSTVPGPQGPQGPQGPAGSFPAIQPYAVPFANHAGTVISNASVLRVTPSNQLHVGQTSVGIGTNDQGNAASWLDYSNGWLSVCTGANASFPDASMQFSHGADRGSMNFLINNNQLQWQMNYKGQLLCRGQPLDTNTYDSLQIHSRSVWQIFLKCDQHANFWKIGTSHAGVLCIYDASTGFGVFMPPGASAWSANSDERLKDIIEPITDGLSKVKQLRAVIGSWKHDQTKQRHPFLIAQDVQKVLPEAVSEAPRQNDNDTQHLGVAYQEIIPLLVAAINELAQEVEQLSRPQKALKTTSRKGI
jgi:hypothetical protein